MAVDFPECGSEVAEARGKAARIRNPDIVLIVIPGVVEEERLQGDAVFLDQQILELLEALQEQVVGHSRELEVIPGVVRDERAYRRGADAADVVHESLVNVPAGGNPDDNGLARVTFR